MTDDEKRRYLMEAINNCLTIVLAPRNATEHVFTAIEPLIDEAKRAAWRAGWRAGRDAVAQWAQPLPMGDRIRALELPEDLR